MRQFCLFQKNGFILLFSVILIGAIGATLALYLVLTSALSYRGSANVSDSFQARALADACAEIALASAESCSPQTITTSTLGGSCTYTITPNGASRTINVTASSSSFTRRVALTVTFSTSSSSTVAWQEVAQF